MNMDDAGKCGIADRTQAIKVVREHAAEWGTSPDRIGLRVSRPAPRWPAELCSNAFSVC
jgi:hypothetical protein